MAARFFTWRRALVGFVILVALGGAAAVYVWNKPRLPQPGTERYEQYVEAFQLGVAALDADVPQVAEENLNRAVQLVPEEPAGWADRGLLFLRTARFDDAAKDLERARQLAPDNPDIQKLLGLLYERRQNLPQSIIHLRQAVNGDPRDIEALYRLARLLDQQHEPGSDKEYQRLMEQILVVQPNNLQVLLERLRVAQQLGDRKAVDETLARLKKLAPLWTEPTRNAFGELEKSLAEQPAEVTGAMLQFANLLRGEPGYQRSFTAVDPRDALAGASLQTFLRLAAVKHAPAPPDTELTFKPEPIAAHADGRWNVALPVWLHDNTGQPTLAFANARELRLGNAGPLPAFPVEREGLLAIDWNNDFRMDFLLAGANGLRFYQQQSDGSFQDVTAKTGLPADVLGGKYRAAWAADVDLDGDLDIIVARESGPPLLLRNNFDGTFTPQPIFPEVDGLRAFVWADFDNDGAADAALIDAQGHLHVYANERSGQFRKWPVAPPDRGFLGLTVADVNDDGVLDIIGFTTDGALLRISDRDKRAAWDVAEIGQWHPPAAGTPGPGGVRIIAADFDNNGSLDLLVSGPSASALFLAKGVDSFQEITTPLPGRIMAAADLNGDGRVDLLSMDNDGRPIRLLNSGAKNYNWQAVRPQASHQEVKGDNRINSFGIGGEIEIRTGTHVVKQPIAGPVVHFGLGERKRADVVLIRWPNATSQVEFNTPADQAVVAEQRLKGSCPFLFAWNGERYGFVTDFLWSTPLGMYINGQDNGAFLQTTEWVKIGGDQLVPRFGVYDLRVTANLLEVHYYDYLGLTVVDHPPGTQMFVDERFSMTPSEPTFHLTERPHAIAKAWDHHGKDATAEVWAVDGIYLDRCGRGEYQGITEDHWVEVDLGDEAPKEGPLWLVATGWIHPTDSSVNFAINQGTHTPPHALTLEVPDGKGGWKVGRDKLGFPAGKNKTMLIRLDGIEGQGVTRHFRLRTNMEIFWDALQYAAGADDSQAVRKTLTAPDAILQYRGILEMRQANKSSPELPDYDRVVARGQYWRDQIGYYTRYCDVRELLEKIDDRYVILCAGDELVLRFRAPPNPPEGWKRDFIWACDGWTKDGDLNTRFGKYVLPLPAHDRKSYNTPPGRLEDDPVFRRFPKDWQNWHTRFVAPTYYERGLRNFRGTETRSEP
jgi:tetratricopeptide (TPR) repeat protein